MLISQLDGICESAEARLSQHGHSLIADGIVAGLTVSCLRMQR